MQVLKHNKESFFALSIRSTWKGVVDFQNGSASSVYTSMRKYIAHKVTSLKVLESKETIPKLSVYTENTNKF